MCDEDRQCIFMFRTNVNKMNAYSVDLGDELRQGIKSRLALAPIVVRSPVAHELLKLRQLRALRFIRDRLPVGPAGRRNAPAEIDELLLRDIDLERPNCVVVGCCGKVRWPEAEGAGGCRDGKNISSR